MRIMIDKKVVAVKPMTFKNQSLVLEILDVCLILKGSFHVLSFQVEEESVSMKVKV